MTDLLLDRVRALLMRMQQSVAEPAERQTLAAAVARLDEPLRVAIAGKVKAGKSTLLNAMVGEELAPTDAGECTRIVTWYLDGPVYRAVVHPSSGEPEPRAFSRRSGAIAVDLGRPAAEVDRLQIEVPSRRLREHTLIDTPGIASLSGEVSLRTHAFLAADEHQPPNADAVIYLLRHMHAGDVRFLEAFHGDDLVRASPVNAVGVLSRADEIGGCRLDAMDVASTIAARYQSDERLRRLCPVVVPVAGLLAAAGATLREQEFRSLATIARAPVRDVIELLLTADRLSAVESSIPVAPAARRQVLDRLGLFGVRLAVELIREDTVLGAGDLAAELTARSGLASLREILAVQFLGRSRVLKARSALATADILLRSTSVSGTAGLAAEVEEIRASAHEFAEVRLLHLLRSGRLAARSERLEEMDRLLGGAGTDPAARLGVPPDADPGRMTAIAEQALMRWRQIAEHPLSDLAVRKAAQVTVRSCEGVLSALRRPPVAPG